MQFFFCVGTACVSVNARRTISLLCLCLAYLVGAQPHRRFQTYHSHNALPVAMLILALPFPWQCNSSARPCSAVQFRFYAIRSFPIAIISDRSVAVSDRVESVLCRPLPLFSITLGSGPSVTASFQITPAQVYSAQSYPLPVRSMRRARCLASAHRNCSLPLQLGQFPRGPYLSLTLLSVQVGFAPIGALPKHSDAMPLPCGSYLSRCYQCLPCLSGTYRL